MSTPRAGRTARREAAADEPASGEAETGPGREGLLEEGALSQVLGYHVVQASLTTLGLFARHVGEPLGLRPVEFSLLLILQANDRVTPKQLAQIGRAHV